VTGKVHRIPRLLADQHHQRPLGTLTEYRLGSIPIKATASAIGRGVA
jgi:hypothetical protein